MPRVIRDTLISVRELAITAGPFVLLALALLAVAYFVLKPTPPKRVVLATGPDQGAYQAFGKRYQEELRRHGIEVVLQATPGSRQNLRLLRDPKSEVQIAFVQGGAGAAQPSAEEEKEEAIPLESLGSIFYEPLWLFYRSEAAKKLNKEGVIGEIAQLRGLRINVGARGSGTPGVIGRVLRANLMNRDDVQRSTLELTAAVVALLGGELDGLAMVSAPESQLVQMLMQTPGVRLYEFAQAEAYARRYDFLSAVTLPRGVVDISRNVPAEDMVMLAATCSLVAREDLHPALAQLFVQAASRIHSAGGWISRPNQFPSAKGSEFPLAREAERFYRSGPPLLQRYLPFWAANLVDRMFVALISIIAVLIPLARVVPPLYEFRIRSRIFRWYRVLRQIERDLAGGGTPAAELLERLNELDGKVERIAVPLSYADELYTLRSAIGLVRQRLDARRAG